MAKTKKRQWSYVAMLGLSIVVFVLGWRLNLIHLEPQAAGTEAEFRDVYQESGGLVWLKGIFGISDGEPERELAEAMNEVQEEEIETVPDDSTSVNEQENLEQSTQPEMTQESEDVTSVSDNQIEQENQREIFTADSTYFDDALFIGDSRTVGLSEYGNLGQAEVLADSGMSVYKILKTDFPTRSGEKIGLEQLLSDKKFGKVYIMLGINELGYDFDQTVKKYGEVVDMIRRLQPEAIIFVEANLHITGEKSKSSPYYNNENINRFNLAIAQMADEETVFYLDVNPLFDDANGNLSPEYTTDHTHILGKYYSTWVDWILTQAR